MSKRYREALEEVDTRGSRARAARATRDPIDDRASAEAVEVAGGVDAGSSRQDTAGTRGGVATLVRPAPSVPRVVPPPRVSDDQPTASPDSPARHPDASTLHPQPRPGNGPADADEPVAFAWRGRHYDVTRILGHWREEEGWWRRPDGEPIRIEQSDLWRVEAVRGGGMARDQRGVYELSRRGVTWRLDRVWD